VKVHTRGGLAVDIDGAPLRFGHKSPRKPLELLRLLVAGGPGAVAIDELIDGLWPDPEDGGRKAFDITLHRLRKLLGGDSRVAVNGGHAALDPRQVWVDAWAAGEASSLEWKSVGDP
jgi:DNA-binding SARP family transcriptional activator